MTGTTLIANALKDIGLLAEGEVTSPDTNNEGLTLLQNFIDSLGIKRPTMFARARTVVNLTSGKQTYTIGVGGDFNVPRPQWIDEATCIQTANSVSLETYVEVLTDKPFAYIPVKGITTGIVTAIWYDHAWASGLGTIWAYPYPNVGGLSLALYGPVAVTGFVDAVTNYTFPPGYAEMLEYQLALRLATRYQIKTLPPLLVKQATDAMAAVMSSNFKPEILGMDPALTKTRSVGSSYYGVLGGVP